ncbi:hypothetical protein [Candidatus Thiodubiliella endoseptemdiera]|uniref:hypothetical protein n=1 Tax=Candidatus Thiodubiliella endoseptemdiera TaxID=2738886 RepID=UPI0034DF86B6
MQRSLNNEMNTMDAYIHATSEKQVELGIDNAQLTQFNAYKTQLNNDIALYTAPMPLPNKSKPTSKRLMPGFSTYAPPLKSAKKPLSPNKTTPPSSSTKTNPAPPTPSPPPP